MLAESEFEPLILADGTRIDPKTSKVIKDKKGTWTEIPSAGEAQAIVARTRRTVVDLPLPPQQMNTVALVVTYVMFGLTDVDIAIATGLSIDQIANIKGLEAFQSLMNTVSQSVLESETDNVRSLFQKHAAGAANKIITIAQDEDGVLGFKASQDILDRAGHRPADIVEHRHTMENALQIEYIKRDNTASVPVIDLPQGDFNEVE